jgi:prepilin-type N-terminal cleavage/methylation domain-containing protein/prepilin-type processing-associated H-X9-DG protein
MRRNRRGFTLVELLVVIAIIGTLVALLLPAVQSARESARANTCSNNIKQLQLALTSYDSQKNKLPGYVNELIEPNGPKDNLGRPEEGRRASWVVMTFPYIEQTPLWDQWSTNFDGTPQAPAIEGLTCPSHPPEIPGDPWLAYVVNSGQGFSDTTRPTPDKNREFPGNGVFFDDNRNPNFGPTDGRGDGDANNMQQYPRIQSSLNYIQSADGTTKTMMISENMHTFYWWYVPNTIKDTKHLFGFIWKNSPTLVERINGDKHYDQPNPGEPNNMADYADAQRYESYGYPSSNHPGVVNVAFCDGHIVKIADSIDPVIYGQLMTSNRNKSKLLSGTKKDRELPQPSDDQF